MVHYRVAVPLHTKPNQTMLRVRHGEIEEDVRIPDGVKPGESFIFEIDDDTNIILKDSHPTTAVRNHEQICIFITMGFTFAMLFVIGLFFGIIYSTKPSIVVTDISSL